MANQKLELPANTKKSSITSQKKQLPPRPTNTGQAKQTFANAQKAENSQQQPDHQQILNSFLKGQVLGPVVKKQQGQIKPKNASNAKSKLLKPKQLTNTLFLLSKNILTKIFLYCITDLSSLTELACVCKRTYMLINNSCIIWEHLLFQFPPSRLS